MDLAQIGMRLFAALLLGGVIGFERQLRQGLGGIRVYTLVCFGSAVFVLSGALAPGGDYSRQASQAMSGIGFLCAGMIFKHGISVRGLNQAATIWCSSGVGVLAGAGLYQAASLGALGILFVHLVMRSASKELESHLFDSASDLRKYRIEAECRNGHIEAVRLGLGSELNPDSPVRLVGISTAEDADSGNRVVRADYLSIADAEDEMQRIVSRVGIDAHVRAIRWERLKNGELGA